MRTAETILGIIHERGTKGLPLEDVYRQLYNPALYLRAYGRIYGNKGSMTPGTTIETVDGMSLSKIQAIIETLKTESFRWTPVRRVYIPKSNGKMRPLGLPTWTDKLLQEQEVVHSILEAYYEPQFSDYSHGFRPQRGCHTALNHVYVVWRGTTWFIEGDIAQCFDRLDHTVLMSILRERIHDNRFLRLIENLLQAGYLEEWRYNKTLSGTPQGGIVSPILTNIYLDRLDKFVENNLILTYNRGTNRKENPEHRLYRTRQRRARLRGDIEGMKANKKIKSRLPSKNPTDPNYRRLRYIRYADDFLLGFAGPRQEAEEIKLRLTEFLRENLKLELSETKTLITHAKTENAKFLGYEISIYADSDARSKVGQRITGGVALRVPVKLAREKSKPYTLHGKPKVRMEMINDDVYSIVTYYEQEFRGLVEYYRMALNLHKFARLRWAMQRSLVHTLSRKLKISTAQVYKRYSKIVQTETGPRRVLAVTIEREGRKSLTTLWGITNLRHRRWAVLEDTPQRIWSDQRVELVERLLADTCELCGSTENIQVHHIRHLRDLKKKGRAEKPAWVQKMAARHRKTLVVCHQCHESIHNGQLSPRKHG